MSVMSTALLGIKGLLGVAMVGAGGMKLAGAEDLVEDFERYGYPQWFRALTGAIEVLAAVVLFASFFMSSSIELLGSVVVVVVMFGALVTHVKVGDDVSDMIPPVVLLALALVVALYNVGFIG